MKTWIWLIAFLMSSSAMASERLYRPAGLVKPRDRFLGVNFFNPLPEGVGDDQLPDHFDWRDYAGVTPVRDQGQCGSCWAFGTTAVLESAVKRWTGKDIDLSEQHIVSCDTDYNGCGGGYFAHDFQQKFGQALESDYPYSASDSRCKSNVTPGAKVFDWAYVGAQNRKPTNEELKEAIFRYGPVAVTVAASGAWSNYHSGVFNGCSGGQTNHIVALVGWDVAHKTWLMRNSWGLGWGDKGYMEIPWGCDSIAEEATFAFYLARPVDCSPPILGLSKNVAVEAGHDLYLRVPEVEGFSYSWETNGEVVATTAVAHVKPKVSAVYTVHVRTECGEASASTRVRALEM